MTLPDRDPEDSYDGRHDGPVHEWFGLTYSNYLVLQRAILSGMPLEWQYRFVACLRELDAAVSSSGIEQELPDNYVVLPKDMDNRFTHDPYSKYRHSTLRLGD